MERLHMDVEELTSGRGKMGKGRPVKHQKLAPGEKARANSSREIGFRVS